jgi:hypothetical protein
VNRRELFRELLARITPPEQVYIDGVRDDGWPETCYYLIETPAGWQVGSQERGKLFPRKTYADESEACQQVFDLYAHQQHWPAAERPDADPVPWTPRLRAGGVRIAQDLAKPIIGKVAESSRSQLRVAVQPPFTLDAVPDQPAVLRPASEEGEKAASYALLDELVVDATLAEDGELRLRLADADQTGVTTDDLARNGVLRRIAIVDDQGPT